MSKFICRICLHTELNVRDIEESLVDFHDEITEFAIYENTALKYCTVCEYYLRKFYYFRERCKQADKILKKYKQKKNGFPSNLHQMLPPKSLGLSRLNKLKVFNLQDGKLQPLCQVQKKEDPIHASPEMEGVVTLQVIDTLQSHDVVPVTIRNDYGFDTRYNSQIPESTGKMEATGAQELFKQENDSCSDAENKLQTHDYQLYVDDLQTNDLLQINDTVNAPSKDMFKEKLECPSQENNAKGKKTLFPMVNINLENKNSPTECVRRSSPSEIYSINVTDTKEIDKPNIEDIDIKLKCETNNLFDENELTSASDTKVIAELKNEFEVSICKNKIKGKQMRALRNRTEVEKVFDILLFATDEEAKEEMEQRKLSEPFLSAQNKCNICYTVYKCAKLLAFHMRWHDPSAGEYVCNICQMRFRSEASCRRHKATSHYGRFKCKMCPMITYQKSSMVTHYQKHAGVIFKCEKCFHVFNHCSSYKNHMRMQHQTEHICVTCARTFVSEKGLVAHRNLVHKIKLETDSTGTAHCKPCGLTFANEQVLTIHIKNSDVHKDLASTIIACKFCGIQFKNNEEVRQHKRMQKQCPGYKTIAKPPNSKDRNKAARVEVKCTICGHVCKTTVWLTKHIVAEHPDSPYVADLMRRRQYMCDTCGKCYTTKYTLQDHINTHTGLKPYACELCPSRFTSCVNLRIHSDYHAPARRECTRCGKKFVSASNLSNHMRSHIQDRRYKCSVCHKGFYHSGTLREHVRGVHHNVRRVRNTLNPKRTRTDKRHLDII